MASIVKCNTCNIVIDELLAYVQNKVSIMDEDSLKRICVTSFKSDEIKRSKTLLFESLPADNKRIISRKGKAKENRDIEDIINFFKGSDHVTRPVFVARQLEKLPPLTFNSVDVTKLLKDLLVLQNEVKDLREKCVTVDQLENIKKDIKKGFSEDALDSSPALQHRNVWVNTKRGACLDSGPMGLSQINASPENNSLLASSSKTPTESRKINYPTPKKTTNSDSAVAAALAAEEGSGKACTAGTDNTEGSIAGNLSEQLIDTATHVNISPLSENANRKSFVDILKTDGEWKTVPTGRQKQQKNTYRYLGRVGVSGDKPGRFRAAEKHVPIFITKVHKDTTEQDIADYIFEQTSVHISLDKITTSKEKHYHAYKFFVPESKLPIFLDSKLWPENIIFRRFTNFRSKYTSIRAADGLCILLDDKKS
ncbi:uncharacterized protein LOC133521445 [Cydia pomonella]|uniref:uncharacterized protein LOC133521445 n=1 Tax=Cydia pomonella TaxID=82600 RepID=UPI002ADE6819|nr:uncharacterized protein LOC133521445 [Cydia pomonella]